MSKQQIRIRLRDLRKDRAMTQEALADSLGISRQTVISLERGRCLPSLPLALQIAEVFALPLEEVFVWDQAIARQIMSVSELIHTSPLLLAAQATPPLQIEMYEEAGQLVVEAPVPGFSREDVGLFLTGFELQITGERQDAQERTHSFSQTVELPDLTDTAKLSATVTNGLLRITGPLKEASGPRRIPIK